MIGLLVSLLGFTLVVQLRGNTADERLQTARQDDLVRILSDLDARQTRLREEIGDLEDTSRKLESGAHGAEEALAEARRQADDVGILAGILPAEGPGLIVVFREDTGPIRASLLLNAIEELRGAGAEAMQIRSGAELAIRIVASTYVIDSSGGRQVVVDGVTLTAPYTLDVIGDPATMRTAMNIPGGVIDNVRRGGGTVAIDSKETVTVSALHHEGGLKYAKPTS